MNTEKQIAQAIVDAQKMYEESYLYGNGERIGYYTKEMEDCLIATCKKNKLSSNLWALLNLAMHWDNNIQLWAEDVLTDKNILEEMKKEDAALEEPELTEFGNIREDIKYPICPINLYFEGDENKCNTSKCNWDTETRSCNESCKIN